MPETGIHTQKSPPNRCRLNDRFVRTARPEAKRKLYWDTLQPGLVLSVEPTGSKSFKLIYTFNNRPRWFTLGNAEKVSLRDARAIARRKMGEVYLGTDIQAERQIIRKAGTFEELAERYFDEHAKLRNKSWKHSEFLVHTYLLPRWANLQAVVISQNDAQSVFDRITRAGSPALANQVLAAASAVFSWAIKKKVGRIRLNPCKGIDRNPTKSRERVLSSREVPLFWHAFEEAGLVRCSALRMILLTGQRPGEVRCMKWEHIEDSWWTLPGEPNDGWPGTKNKQTHRVWLSQPAHDILEEASTGGGPGFVFPGARGGPVKSLDAAMRSICQELRVNEKVTPHDLRRTHGTTVTSLGFTRHQMNRLQNHKEGGIGSVYDRHSYAEENRHIQDSVAERIMMLISPLAAPKDPLM